MKKNPETVLVTGGAGFIGSHVVDYWVKKGAQVVVLDNLSTGKKEWISSGAVFEKVNAKEIAQIEKIISKYQPKYIYHFAGHTRLREALSNPIQDAEDNLISTIVLLQACSALDEKIGYLPEQFIFASTSAVYGGNLRPPFSETSKVSPSTPYGIAKLSAERYIEWFHQMKGVRTTILRYANVYGPRQSSSGEAGVVSKFMTAMTHNQDLCVYGDGSHVRDYIHVSDVVSANVMVVQQKSQGTFVVGTGVPTSTKQLAHMCTALCPLSQIAFTDAPLLEQSRSWLNAEALQKASHWRPKVSLKQGLAETFLWYQVHAKE